MGSWQAPPTARMTRIAVIGCGGSGKTLLANRLGVLLDLPVVHLDGAYYDTDWRPKPREGFAALQDELAAQPRWIMDGNYSSSLHIRLARADTVVFLDLPAYACLRGILSRRLRYHGGQHADGVYDRITWSFVRYICGYRRTMRPRVMRLIADHGSHARLVHLTSRCQVRRFLDQADQA